MNTLRQTASPKSVAITQSGGAESGTSFNWEVARWLARFSAEAYQRANITDAKTDTQVLVQGIHPQSDVIPNYPNGVIVVAFRGTSSIEDFVQDAKFWRVHHWQKHRRSQLLWDKNGSPAEVHQGFLECFEAVSEAVWHRVRDLSLAMPQADIYVTGHSLGGALANLGALELKRRKLPIKAVYTFGQPRVGNATFASIYNDSLGDRTWRIVNGNDIVPRSPLWITGYRHSATEIFLPPGGGYVPNPPLDIKLIDDLYGLRNAVRSLKDVLIANHFIAAYQARMEHLQ